MSATIHKLSAKAINNPSDVAAKLSDFVVNLEEHRDAFASLAGLNRGDVRYRLTLFELHNLAYEFQLLCRAFGMSMDDAIQYQGPRGAEIRERLGID